MTELEGRVIARFKEEVSSIYIQRLENMLADIEKSSRFQERFRKECKDSLALKVEVKVIGVGHWPEPPV